MSSWIICWELCCCFWICSESCCIWLSHSRAPSGACNPPWTPSAFIAPPSLLDWIRFYVPAIKGGHTCRVSLEGKDGPTRVGELHLRPGGSHPLSPTYLPSQPIVRGRSTAMLGHLAYAPIRTWCPSERTYRVTGKEEKWESYTKR